MCTYLHKVKSTYYFRRPVPKHLIGHFRTANGAARTEWCISLRVKDREQAKRLLPTHTIETDRLIENAEAEISATALVSQMTAREREELEAERRDAVAKAERYDGRRELRILLRQRLKLTTAELPPELAAARDLINEQRAEAEAAKAALAAIRWDNEAIRISGGTSASYASLLDLFDDYARTSGARVKTTKEWRPHVERLVEFLGHDNAASITALHIVKWVEHLEAAPSKRGQPLSPQTVRKSYLPAVRLALGAGVRQGLLSQNVAEKLPLPRIRKPVQSRERDFRTEEIVAILSRSLQPQAGRVQEPLRRAIRWAGWLCAYSGARVGEILQLRSQDVAQMDGIWSMHITPEAGSTKTDKPRWVPIHEHLLAQGFVEVAQRANGPLFYPEGRTGVEPYKPNYNRYREWVRTFLKDKSVQPCHAWRHTFKTLGRDCGMDADTLDAIQGHTPPTEGKAYGSFSIKKKATELEKLPRYPVDA